MLLAFRCGGGEARGGRKGEKERKVEENGRVVGCGLL